MSLESGKERYTFSQGTTAKRVADADKGPIGEATFCSRFRNLSGDERQMHREFVSGVPNGIGEIVGQKVDDIATIVQPLIYARGDKHQLRPIGLEKALTECAKVLPVYQCRVSVVYGFPRPDFFNNWIIIPAV